MKKTFVFLFAALLGLYGAAKAAAESEVNVQRAESRINSGFRERVYIDGREVLTLRNGESGKIKVPDGEHTIHADLYSLTTNKLTFTVRSSSVKFVVTAHSMQNFVIEQVGEQVAGRPAPAAAAPAPIVPQFDDPFDDSVEGSLARAANVIMGKITPNSRIAIVYVTANDREISEFIEGELEYIMVGKGFILIDRNQLEVIRKEQAFQSSGAVNDSQAVSIGKIAGANVIITGTVTGTGELRRLRLRALSTETGQVLITASEKY
jgi:5-keto 4-deoxyuronate isomerase